MGSRYLIRRCIVSRGQSGLKRPRPSQEQSRSSFKSGCKRFLGTDAGTDAGTSYRSLVDSAEKSLELVHKRMDLEAAVEELRLLDQQTSEVDLWDNPDRANVLMKKRAHISSQLDRYSRLKTALRDTVELYDLASRENDTSVMEECTQELRDLATNSRRMELEVLLNDDTDHFSCLIEILAGAGGQDSYDWTESLMNMYASWGRLKGFECSIIDENKTPEGIRNGSLRLEGHLAYGWTKSEAGVHRRVRISPFDTQTRRQTAFAQVRVYPLIPEISGDLSKSSVVINPKDLRIDTYRASGAGGQHVNRTDSAVRITHTATGIVVQCQNERSQHRNKATAMEVLRAKLLQKELEDREVERRSYAKGLGENTWGHQIRSYVLNPYQMVKDHRTGYQVGDVHAVLNGEIDRFLEEGLAARANSNQDGSSR